MLREIPHVKQVPGEARRRWFMDDELDLVVWFDAQDQVLGFQLTYDKPAQPHALTWHKNNGFRHDSVDDGENRPGRYKGSPILLENGPFHGHTIAERFWLAAAQLEPSLAETVYSTLQNFDEDET